MTSSLQSMENRVISVITGDGRSIVGLLKGFDQLINLVLEDAHERVYSENAGVEQIPLGLYIIRGENVVAGKRNEVGDRYWYTRRLIDAAAAENIAVVGEIDEEMDKRIDFPNVKAAPLQPIWLGS